MDDQSLAFLVRGIVDPGCLKFDFEGRLMLLNVKARRPSIDRTSK
jgi:hypothetical protein